MMPMRPIELTHFRNDRQRRRTHPWGLSVAAILAASLPALAQPSTAPSKPPAKKDAQGGAARLLAVGEKVRVSSSGGWYDATVLELGSGNYKIHYEGWANTWDEWVSPERIRRADGGPVAAPVATARPSATTPAQATPSPSRPEPAPQQPVTVWSTSPSGRWGCRTWDSGQVNRVGEFLLREDGTYSDARSKGTGRYTFDKASGRLTFTSGPQKTQAAIQFIPSGHQGKGHLRFDYGGGATLDCYREALP